MDVDHAAHVCHCSLCALHNVYLANHDDTRSHAHRTSSAYYIITSKNRNRPGDHPNKNLKIKIILTFSCFCRKVKINLSFSYGTERKLR